MIPQRIWQEKFAEIIRDVFFADTELKRLMKIPENTTIIQFIDKYFIRAGYTNTQLTNEAVRIVYGTYGSWSTDSEHVYKHQLTFDIYVKTSELHNSESNRLLYRTDLIADRIRYLLTCGDRYVKNAYRFWYAGEADLGSSTIGYSRHNISFNYMKTV